jgi:predicted transcriptional regulator
MRTAAAPLTAQSAVDMNDYMKQLLVEVDDATFENLERVAPARSRRRSAFIRAAVQKAIIEQLERTTEEAYRRVPDREEEAWFDPSTWERPGHKAGRKRK